jgi:hypothetical protein
MWKKPNREDGKNEFLKIRNQQLFSFEVYSNSTLILESLWGREPKNPRSDQERRL